MKRSNGDWPCHPVITARKRSPNVQADQFRKEAPRTAQGEDPHAARVGRQGRRPPAEARPQFRLHLPEQDRERQSPAIRRTHREDRRGSRSGRKRTDRPRG